MKQSSQKIYWLMSLPVVLTHLESGISLLHEEFGEIYATNNH